MSHPRKWTIYIAQDKHLDYNWCGTRSEIEVRMAALLDGYLSLAEQNRSRWNLDCTWWYEVYRRQRGVKGEKRLSSALQNGKIGCGANIGVMLWGLLNTELSFHAFYQSLEVAESTGAAVDTALIMENPGMPWSVASVMTASGIPYLARGIYDLRARSYNRSRQPYPLFWWEAPDGSRLLVHWDLYEDNFTWGGYSEAFQIAKLAGEEWNALSVQEIGDRNTPEIYEKRAAFVRSTILHYEAYGENYPVSSILLLGTGWDNWTITDDFARFIERFNEESDGRVRLVDALYQDYFIAVDHEIRDKGLTIPTLAGSFGISWEEWAAHLAGPTREFRQASRLMGHAQAQYALDWLSGGAAEKDRSAIIQGVDACLRFAEHDFSGIDRKTAAISAGVRAGAAMEANTLFRALSPVSEVPSAILQGERTSESCQFSWRDWQVNFDAAICAVVSLKDSTGWEWVPQQSSLALGSFLHALHREDQLPDTVLPDTLPHDELARQDYVIIERGENGVQIRTSGQRWGFGFQSQWFFHASQPWINIVYDLEGGWTEAPQTMRFCFPFNLPDPIYTYDMAGTILSPGVGEGGNDLGGANPVLYAMQTYAQISSVAEIGTRTAVVLSPDVPLVQFGTVDTGGPAAILSMPMMNLTRNDWQFNQGGLSRWQFRYRLVLGSYETMDEALNPSHPLQHAQMFGVPTFLQMPGAAPVLAGLEDLCIDFPGGPVTALKRSQDGKRLILRLWNVLDIPVAGTAKLPDTFIAAEVTDALERYMRDAELVDGKIRYTVPAGSLFTLAFTR